MNKELLTRELENLGYRPSKDQVEGLIIFYRTIVEKNKQINLTSILGEEEFLYKHIIDSLLLNKAYQLKDHTKLIDIGTGAGFPGLPIKIMHPEIDVCLVDSTRKKIDFLRDLVEKLRLKGSKVVEARAEDLGKNPDYREAYDYVVSRAVAPLNKLSEYCIPLLKEGGLFIAFKAKKADEEIFQAREAIKKLGGRLEKEVKVELKSDYGLRNLILIEKVKATPKIYPRPNSQINSRPL